MLSHEVSPRPQSKPWQYPGGTGKTRPGVPIPSLPLGYLQPRPHLASAATGTSPEPVPRPPRLYWYRHGQLLQLTIHYLRRSHYNADPYRTRHGIPRCASRGSGSGNITSCQEMSPTPGKLVSDLTSYIRSPHSSFWYVLSASQTHSALRSSRD